MSPSPSPFLFSFRFSIYMPYCSAGILPFMEIIKHPFKGTSTVLVSEKKLFYLCPDFNQVLTVLFIFCKAGCIENVTKDVPRSKLYTYSAYFETFLWKRGNRDFWHFPTFWTAVHHAATKCHISKSWHLYQLYGAACCREESMRIMFRSVIWHACRSQLHVPDWSLDY